VNFVPEEGRPFHFFDGEVKIGNYVLIGANAVIAKPVKIAIGQLLAQTRS